MSDDKGPLFWGGFFLTWIFKLFFMVLGILTLNFDHSLSLSLSLQAPSDPTEPEMLKIPIIISQPPPRINVEVGEELKLTVEVRGEEPIG